jgi:hypothetical protein
MASYTLFTNPMSRGQIARWALHEAGADYDQIIVSYTEPKPEALLAANPMGKLPTLIHHGAGAITSSPNAPRSAPIWPRRKARRALPPRRRNGRITTAGCSLPRARWNRRSPRAALVSSPMQRQNDLRRFRFGWLSMT